MAGSSNETIVKTAEKTVNNASFERILSNLPVKSEASLPLLRDFASPPGVLLLKRLDRRYRRLCFVQGELKSLAEKGRSEGKSSPRPEGLKSGMDGIFSFEDYVFANTDFSRYAKVREEEIDFFLEGITDFENDFFVNNFKTGADEAVALIHKNYKKAGPYYCLARPNAVILSLMRTLETSLESVPLVREKEIAGELNALYDFFNSQRPEQDRHNVFTPETAAPFFNFLIKRLDNISIVHSDGNTTKLFINPEGVLSGTFMPCGKPWTLALA